MKSFYGILAFSLFLVIFGGCSNNSGSPVMDDQFGYETRPSMETVYLGTLEINPETMTIENYPLRDVDYLYNITGFLSNKCPGGCFRFRIVRIMGTVLEIELTLENPTAIQVYDVRLEYLRTYGKTVLNPDSYTDFLGSGSNNIIPFTAFATDNPNRAFPLGPGATDVQTLFLDFPPGAPSAVNYAITVSYPGMTLEPYEINNMVQDGTLTPTGGSAEISCNVLDHQGDIKDVYLDARPFTGNYELMTVDMSNPNRYKVSISNVIGAPVGSYVQLIRASSPNPQNVRTYNYVTISVTPQMTSGLVVFKKDYGYLYTCNPDGTNMRNLYINGYYPCISQSNNIIVYCSSYAGDLRACNVDGSNDRLIKAGTYKYPSVTADGSKIVFYDSLTPSHCFIINSDGSGFRQLSPADDTADWRYPSISGSGNRVAMMRLGNPSEIYVCNPDGSGLTLVKTDAEYCLITYNGEWIYYTAPFVIKRIRYNGTGDMQVAYTAATSRFGMTPDGSKVSYTLYFSPPPPDPSGNDLMVTDVNTMTTTRLTWGAMNAGQNTITADGKWVIFDAFAVGPMRSIKTDGSMGGVPIQLANAGDDPSCHGTIGEYF